MSKTKQAFGRFRDQEKSEMKIQELGKPKRMLSVRGEFVKKWFSLFEGQCIEEIELKFSFYKPKKRLYPQWISIVFKES
jgi:hypothetical protein